MPLNVYFFLLKQFEHSFADSGLEYPQLHIHLPDVLPVALTFFQKLSGPDAVLTLSVSEAFDAAIDRSLTCSCMFIKSELLGAGVRAEIR